MTDVYNNIYRIKTDNYNHGCGFIWNKYFITAGHVINDSINPYFEIDGTRIDLANPIVCMEDKEECGFDLAVFELPELLESPFNLLEELPCSGTVVNNHHLKEVIVENGHFNYVPIDCTAEVSNYFEGNYYSILTSINLKAGCSGSPVLVGNNVVGIIVLGNNKGDDTCLDENLPLNFCLVLSSKSIINKLRTLNCPI